MRLLFIIISNNVVILFTENSSNSNLERKNKKSDQDTAIILTFDGTPVRKLYVTNLPPFVSKCLHVSKYVLVSLYVNYFGIKFK